MRARKGLCTNNGPLIFGAPFDLKFHFPVRKLFLVLFWVVGLWGLGPPHHPPPPSPSCFQQNPGRPATADIWLKKDSPIVLSNHKTPHSCVDQCYGCTKVFASGLLQLRSDRTSVRRPAKHITRVPAVRAGVCLRIGGRWTAVGRCSWQRGAGSHDMVPPVVALCVFVRGSQPQNKLMRSESSKCTGVRVLTLPCGGSTESSCLRGGTGQQTQVHLVGCGVHPIRDSQ